jgi:hypothetical protein
VGIFHCSPSDIHSNIRWMRRDEKGSRKIYREPLDRPCI